MGLRLFRRFVETVLLYEKGRLGAALACIGRLIALSLTALAGGLATVRSLV